MLRAIAIASGFFAALACVPPASAADAAPAGRIAILALVGDRITVVTRQDSTGSAIDHNRKTPVAMDGHPLDALALETADDAVRAAAPGATTTLLRASDPALYALQDEILDARSDEQVAQLQAALRATLAGREVDRLLLVLKARGPAEWPQGGGKVEGLGFYVVPPFRRDQRIGARERPGMVVTYAGLRVLLLDARSLAVIREDWTLAHAVRRVRHDAESFDAWQKMTPEEKDAALRRLLVREIRRMVPPLIG